MKYRFIYNPDCRYPEILIKIEKTINSEDGSTLYLITNKSGSIKFCIRDLHNLSLGCYAGQIEGSIINLKQRIAEKDFEMFSN